MKKSSFMQLLVGRVGNIQNQSDIDLLTLEVSLAQEVDLEQNGMLKPWFLESEEATTDTIPHESRVELPEDFIGEVEEGALYILHPETAKWAQLTRGMYDQLALAYFDEDEGIPEQYAITGAYYRFFPIPNAAMTLRQRYYEKDTAFETVGDGSENRWLKYASDLLLGQAGFQYATKHLQNPQLAQLFAADVPAGWTRLQRENERRKHSNMIYQMGVD